MQQLKPVVSILKMVPLGETVAIPFVQQFLNAEKQVQANEVMETAATALLDELARWATALQSLRFPAERA